MNITYLVIAISATFWIAYRFFKARMIAKRERFEQEFLPFSRYLGFDIHLDDFKSEVVSRLNAIANSEENWRGGSCILSKIRVSKMIYDHYRFYIETGGHRQKNSLTEYHVECDTSLGDLDYVYTRGGKDTSDKFSQSLLGTTLLSKLGKFFREKGELIQFHEKWKLNTLTLTSYQMFLRKEARENRSLEELRASRNPYFLMIPLEADSELKEDEIAYYVNNSRVIEKLPVIS